MQSKYADKNPPFETIPHPPRPLWRHIAWNVGCWTAVMLAIRLIEGEKDWRENWMEYALAISPMFLFEAISWLMKRLPWPEFLLRPPTPLPASADGPSPQTPPIALKVVWTIVVACGVFLYALLLCSR